MTKEVNVPVRNAESFRQPDGWSNHAKANTIHVFQ